MTNFVCVPDRSTFRAVFLKCAQAYLLTEVFMLKKNFTAVSLKSNTKFSVILIVRNKTFLLHVTKHKF